MYILLYLITFLNILFFTKVKYKTIIKSNILFTGMWCFCAGLSSLGLFDLYKPSPIIHLYSFTAIIVFNIVFLTHNNVKNNSIDYTRIEGSLRLKVILIVNIVAWIYSAPFLYKSINIISSVGLSGLRGYAFNSEMGLGSSMELLILQWIVYSIFVATILIAMVYLAMGRKSWLLVSIALIDVLIYTLLFGGRALILRMMLYYIFTYLIVKSTHLKNFKKKKLSFTFIAVIIGAVFFITSQRNWGDSSFIENTIIYYIGSFSFLEILIDSSVNNSSGYLFGGATLGFIYNLFLAPLSFILGIPYNGSDYIITQITAIPKFISPTQSYNAMTTMLYPLLRDLGYIGIILGTAFVSWCISSLEKLFNNKNQLIYLCLYIYFLYILFDSVMTYQLLRPATGITMLLVFLFIKSKKYPKEKQ